MGFNPKREARPSQTLRCRVLLSFSNNSFNPKREARPSQTPAHYVLTYQIGEFQSQTGSQALSDRNPHTASAAPHVAVSIPNGKPGPLRLSIGSSAQSCFTGFNPKREARPSQTLLAR